MIKINYYFYISISLLFLLCSCAKHNHASLYDMPGFDPGTRPNMFLGQQNRDPSSNITYEEFYQQDMNARQQEQVITEQIINNQRQQDPNAARSRFYNNPYDFVRPNYYPTADIERYYVPPNYYRNIERSYMVPTTPNPQFQR